MLKKPNSLTINCFNRWTGGKAKIIVFFLFLFSYLILVNAEPTPNSNLTSESEDTAIIISNIDNLNKFDQNLTNLMINGDPEEELVVGLLIRTDSNGYIKEIKKEKEPLTEQIVNISNDIKRKHNEIDKILNYSSEEIVENFKTKNKKFINNYWEEYRNVAFEVGLTEEFMKNTRMRIKELRILRDQKTTAILKKYFYPSQEQVIKEVNSISETDLISQHILLNSITINTKVKYLDDISKIEKVFHIYRPGIYKEELNTSVSALGVDVWHTNGYDGGLYDAVVIDLGIDFSHPALTNLLKKQKTFGYGSGPYCSSTTDYDDAASGDGHGTLIAGIIKGQKGTTPYEGVAPSLGGNLFNAKLCAGGFNYVMDAVEWAVIDGSGGEYADIISLSSGYGDSDQGTTIESKLADSIVYNYDKNWVKSAGNDGSGGNPSSITAPGGGFNVIAVGNIDDKNTIIRSDDDIRDSSSRGPSGSRIKPDVVAPGSYITTTSKNWEGGNPDYTTSTGTSFAAPHIAGIITLLRHYNSGLTAQEQRALLINTAEDCELDDPQGGDCPGDDGPDNTYGFGYVDMDELWVHKDDVITATISKGGDDFFKVSTGGGMNSKDTLTLVWDRFVNLSGEDDEVLDIELRLWEESDGTLVDLDVDGVEDVRRQVSITESGNNYVVVLDAEANYGPDVTENYAISHQGESISSVQEPSSMTVTAQSVDSIDCQEDLYFEIEVKNDNQDISIHNVEVTLNLPDGLSIISGSNPQDIESIGADMTKSATWILKGSFNGTKQISANVTSDSYNLDLTGSDSKEVNITGICGNLPPVFNFAKIEPSNPVSVDALNCSFQATDDGNSTGEYTYNISWYKNDAFQTDDNEFGNFSIGQVVYTNDTGNVEIGDTLAGEEWICNVVINDGYDTNVLNSSKVIIQTGPPTVPTSITCDGTNCTENKTFVGEVEIIASGSTDMENDSVTYIIEAFFNHTGNVTKILTKFNNSLLIENLSFAQSNNITRYLDIPQNVTILSAKINISGASSGQLEYTGFNCTLPSGFNQAAFLALDSDGNMFVTDTTISGPRVARVVKINPDTCSQIGSSCNLTTSHLNSQVAGMHSDGTYIWFVGDTVSGNDRAIRFTESCGYSAEYTLEATNTIPRGITQDDDFNTAADFYINDRGGDDSVHHHNPPSGFSFIEEFVVRPPIDMIDGIDYASITDTFWIVDQAFELFEFNRSFSVLQAELSPDPYFGSFADITTNATYIWIPKMGTPSKIYRYWHQNSFPNNIFLDVGNDGDHEFNNTGSFEIEVNIDFTDELNSLLSDCNLVGDNCSIPFKFHSDTVGEIRYHSIEIEYEYTMENEYFFDTIGNHSEEGSFIWNISNIQEQSDVNIRTRAIDLEGSNKFSDYFTSESNITLSQNNPPIIKSVFILPIDPHTEDNLTCGINITDVDVGDTLTANVTWLKNNDPHTSDDEQLNITNGNLIFTTQVGDIEANDTIIYDEWICVVTAYDGISSTLKSSNTTTIVPHAIFNFSLLNVTDLDAVFEFTILDNNLSISLFSWILDTGEGHSINSTENIFLNDMENIFVIIEYNYTSSGQYNVTAKVDLGEVEDTKTINITI